MGHRLKISSPGDGAICLELRKTLRDAGSPPSVTLHGQRGCKGQKRIRRRIERLERRLRLAVPFDASVYKPALVVPIQVPALVHRIGADDGG
jgi:hypothetical protein